MIKLILTGLVFISASVMASDVNCTSQEECAADQAKPILQGKSNEELKMESMVNKYIIVDAVERPNDTK